MRKTTLNIFDTEIREELEIQSISIRGGEEHYAVGDTNPVPIALINRDAERAHTWKIYHYVPYTVDTTVLWLIVHSNEVTEWITTVREADQERIKMIEFVNNPPF